MPSVNITWRIKDAGACPICKEIDGWYWEFPAGNGPIQELVHPEYGVVWTRSLGSNAHAKHKATCRCHLELEVDYGDILSKVEKLEAAVEAQYGVEEPPKL